ncbi:electron transfer flavoprotein-ubiquinone oxidoreductase [Bowmanella sp. JS7-9]|uniref:Electron transfer flavoprotein-ubiquinone oxidoreductase n=1 Tax=Pseudobowmanella zhangzhouensis TaxID=1537679 RepID=A0ABW1XK54_9ALTE|nr:electron transfer flavoprotein-ubiquinone oxidoreductase [Bowmanella sp. JS7-9]
MERESMEFDVVIVGAGPAGLCSAIRLMQLAQADNKELMVCVVEKGSEVGAHILSGAVVSPRALDELLPNWRDEAPRGQAVTADEIYLLKDAENSWQAPPALTPHTMHNQGNYIMSMGNMCRWLAQQAEALGVEIFPGFAAAEVFYNDDGAVGGVITGDMGVGADGEPKDGFMPGMILKAKYTIFAEGCRGHLGKQLMAQFELNKNTAQPQHYAIGFKEIWDIPAEQHQPGLVVHTGGWPLTDASGGGYLYHAEDNQVWVGLIIDLNYRNPHLSPFDEFQRYKHHPLIANTLKNGKRVSYGARAIAKGGLNSLPKMTMPGAILAGCEAGTLNFSKIKGNHTAMKSGMLVAESIFTALQANRANDEISDFDDKFKASWLYDELYRSRNFGAVMHKFGSKLGGAYNTIDQNLFGGKLPFNFIDLGSDHAQLIAARQMPQIAYPKPDGVLSFDKLSSVYISNTNHEEDQPCHLRLQDSLIPVQQNLPEYDEPAQRYCPAGVYEIIRENDGQPQLQINSQNCIHCKTCDIKDPAQNINWVVPEGGGGPNYPNM